MAALFRKSAVLICIILVIQLMSPGFINIRAESLGDGTKDTIPVSELTIGFQTFPAAGIKAVIKDKLAYVTAGMAGLFVIDIHNPNELRQVAYLELPEAVSLIEIHGSHIYLPAQRNLYIVDITDPQKMSYTKEESLYPDEPQRPEEPPEPDEPSDAEEPSDTDQPPEPDKPSDIEELPVSIAADSDCLFLASQNNIMVFSLTEPGKPVLMATFCPDSPDEVSVITDIAVHNGTVYAARKEKGIGIYSLTDEKELMYKAEYSSPAGFCANVDFYGDNAFLSIPDKNYLEILDISAAENPKHISEIKNLQSVICFDGNIAYAVNSLGFLAIIDTSKYLPIAEVKEEPTTKNKKTAYITIDDGPSKSITPKNLETLKKYGVKATFFVLPNTGVDDIYKRIIDEGHVIGNHSYSHDYDYLYGSIENFKKDVIKANDLIYKKTGYKSTVFRFPGGTVGRSKSIINERAKILADLGYKYFDWDVTLADTDPNLKKYGNEEYIVNLLTNNVIKNTGNRKKLVILMHDSAGKNYSAKALPKIIEGLKELGYGFDVLTNY